MKIKLIVGTDIGLRENNEDNFTASADLSKTGWTAPVDANAVYTPGVKGCLMMVADGMGGQNAGEVASALAVQTVQECFASDRLPDDLVGNGSRISSYLKDVVRMADRRIKEYGDAHPESRGMGSTMVLAWFTGNSVHVAWIGDSRAYSYVPGKGIARLSKDHSYVQQLVDEKRITEEQVLSHPDSNIITRSLGDPSSEARADVTSKRLEPGEIIMLCSDGLCGVCPDEQIGGIIESLPEDLSTCKDKLIASALSAGGTDNITIALARVVSVSEKKPSVVSRSFTLGNVLLVLFCTFLLGTLGYAGRALFFHSGSNVADPVPAKTTAVGAVSADSDSTDTTTTDSAVVNANDTASNRNGRGREQVDTLGSRDSLGGSTGQDGVTPASDSGKLSLTTAGG